MPTATTGDDPLHAWHLRQLRRTLAGLAAAGVEQPALFPEWVTNADELAFDFDHWAAVIRGGEIAIERSQVEALDAISGKLATISKDGAEFDLELWTDAAMRTSEHWADVRRLAAAALDAFGWVEEDRVAEPEP